MKFKLHQISAVMLAAAGLLSGCFVETSENPPPYEEDNLSWEDENTDRYDSHLNRLELRKYQMCSSRYQNVPGITFRSTATDKRICSTTSCGNLPVAVTYLQTKSISGNMWALVEVFDNPYFLGTPAAYEVIQNYQALSPGFRRGTVLQVPTGDYYVRSYLVEPQTITLPSSMRDKVAVDLGHPSPYSVISSVQKVTVESHEKNPCMDAVELNLDQLYVDPQAEPQTDAKFRLNIKTADGAKVERQRDVHIELFTNRDFDSLPAYQWTLPTESLLIQGSLGQSEFVTPNLETGFYFIRAFVDDNGNGAFDPGELTGFAKDGEVIVPMKLEEKHTIPVPLLLAPSLAPASPSPADPA